MHGRPCAPTSDRMHVNAFLVGSYREDLGIKSVSWTSFQMNLSSLGFQKLSMKRQKCIMDYEISLDFSSSWRWADNDRVLVLGWTNPLKQHLHTDEMLSPAVSSLRGYTVLVLCGLFNIFDIFYINSTAPLVRSQNQSRFTIDLGNRWGEVDLIHSFEELWRKGSLRWKTGGQNKSHCLVPLSHELCMLSLLPVEWDS